jgi:hypothetical protein
MPTLVLKKHMDWGGYERRRVMNIEAAYENLSVYNKELGSGALSAWGDRRSQREM